MHSLLRAIWPGARLYYTQESGTLTGGLTMRVIQRGPAILGDGMFARVWPSALLRQPGGIPGGRLGRDHEPSQLPESDFECGPGLEHDSNPKDRGRIARLRALGQGRGSGTGFTAAPGSCDPQRQL